MPTKTCTAVCAADELRKLLPGPDDFANPLYSRYTDPHRVREHNLASVVGAIERSAVTAHCIRTAGELTGIASWRTLPWDSEQLGMKTARIETLAAAGSHEHKNGAYVSLISGVLEDCKSQDVSYLTARVDAADVAAIHALERSGFLLIDSIQTFSLDLGRHLLPEWSAAGSTVRPFQPGDVEDIVSIARASYVCDRFHSDPAISTETANAIHEAWLRNSCAGIACDQVITGVDGTGVASYVTCKLDRAQQAATGLLVGTIVMVATAGRVRGQGWALATTHGALKWFYGQGVQIVEVGTQLRNFSAAALYQKAGFRPTAATFTFRKLL